MGKLYLNYKKHNSAQLGEVLKVKIDENITAEVKENDIYEVELTEGKHNIKMYYEGWSKDELVGYIDQDIDVNGNLYFIYKGHLQYMVKGI